jgi:hypothetical protein
MSSLDRYMAKQKEESMLREKKAFKKYQGYVRRKSLFIKLLNFLVF